MTQHSVREAVKKVLNAAAKICPPAEDGFWIADPNIALMLLLFRRLRQPTSIFVMQRLDQ